MLEGGCDLLVGAAVEGTWLQAVWFGAANRQRGAELSWWRTRVLKL